MTRPVYTDTPPTQPGLYWYRVGPSTVNRVCQVWKEGQKLVCSAGDGVKDVKLFKRKWAGPLLEPE